MAFPNISERVEQFVFRLLSSGLTLSDVVSDLAESLPADAYPGEEPIEVVLEMLCGTIAGGFEGVEDDDLIRATQLIELAHDRTIEHLRLALELSKRMRRNDSGGRPQG